MASGATAWIICTSSVTSIEFDASNAHAAPEPAHTCALPAGSAGRPHWLLYVDMSVSFHVYAPAMTTVWPVPVNVFELPYSTAISFGPNAQQLAPTAAFGPIDGSGVVCIGCIWARSSRPTRPVENFAMSTGKVGTSSAA